MFSDLKSSAYTKSDNVILRKSFKQILIWYKEKADQMFYFGKRKIITLSLNDTSVVKSHYFSGFSIGRAVRTELFINFKNRCLVIY